MITFYSLVAAQVLTISEVVKMAPTEFSVKEAKIQKESKKKREELNMLEGAVINSVIIKCRSAMEIISRIVTLLLAVCGVLAGDDVEENKTAALWTFFRNAYLFLLHPYQWNLTVNACERIYFKK